MSWYEDLIVAGMPIALGVVGSRLVNKDANSVGADDAWGKVMLAMAPLGPSLVSGGPVGANATLKAMRAIESVAHEYRRQVGDVED